MLKKACFIKIVIFLFALSASSSEDYKVWKNVIQKRVDENGHTKSLFKYKHSNILQPNNYDKDKSREFVTKQEKYDELLEQLRTVLTFVLSNPDSINYLTKFDMPVYYIDIRPAEDFESKNMSLILRGNAKSKSGKKNDKKASDSSESSESDENGKDNLRYESCRRGRKKCLKACKSSYREACYIEPCWPPLRRRLRKMCKRSCRKWFS